jgi:hypothetical protein
MYSESWMMDFGSTTEARDLVERFPLCKRVNSGSRMLHAHVAVSVVVYVRLFPLQGGQRVLDLVILGVLESDVVVDAGRFL